MLFSRDSVRKYTLNTFRAATTRSVSRLVLVGSWVVMCIAMAEVMSLVTGIPIWPFARGSVVYFSLSVLMLCVAVRIVYLLFSLSLTIVAENESIKAGGRRHIAYAWTCGFVGMTILLFEVVGILELRFEDPLLAMGGLNTLVEEVRLRIVQAGGDAEGWVK